MKISVIAFAFLSAVVAARELNNAAANAAVVGRSAQITAAPIPIKRHDDPSDPDHDHPHDNEAHHEDEHEEDHDHDHSNMTTCEPHGDHWHCPSGVPEPTAAPSAVDSATSAATSPTGAAVAGNIVNGGAIAAMVGAAGMLLV